MSNFVGIMPKASKEKVGTSNSIQDQLDVLDRFRELIETGQIDEFVITGIDNERQLVLASFCYDIIGGVGILELAKTTMINQQIEK